MAYAHTGIRHEGIQRDVRGRLRQDRDSLYRVEMWRK
jgi:hypothetical protein